MASRNEQLLDALLNGKTEGIVPQSRNEKILLDLINGEKPTGVPQSAKEAYLIAVCEKGVGSAGGSAGGTTVVPPVIVPGGGDPAMGGSTGSGGSSGSGGGSEEWIGDGNTHIWITLHEGRTYPMLGVCPKGTVTVDWGDGTAPDTLTGTSTSTVKWTPNHEYTEPGDYVITLTVEGEMGFMGANYIKHGSYILRHSSGEDGRNIVYRNAIQRVEIGNGVGALDEYSFNECYSLRSIMIPDSVESIRMYSFYNCYSLSSIAIPDNVLSIGNYAFSNCYSLKSITTPDNVLTIGQYSFNNCYSLSSIAIPDNVLSIGKNMFNGCCGISYYDFTRHTAIPTLSSINAFTGISSDCEIRVPAALYDEWVAATNWATYASYIKAV